MSDKECQPEPRDTSSPVRKKLKKASSRDDGVQRRSKSKHVGNKKRKPSKSSAAAAGKNTAQQDQGDELNVCDGRQPLIDRFIARLKVAAEEDTELNRQRMPAIKKLRLLPALTRVVKRPLHGDFLDRGLLSVLKNWLEPLPDQSLPNATIRTALLDILTDLSIDTGDYERREQLKNSGLGRVVMFLSKSDEVTAANRRVATALVHKWSRPIFQNPR